ncbi:MAG TPA: hypothetical protein VFH52_08995 [Rhodanobacteraceae bacterium]|nr:hypothetical protein [Rhodanobacteraceae bacterium]
MLAKRQLGTAALGALAVAIGAAALSRSASRGGRSRKFTRARSDRARPQQSTVEAARRLNRAAGLIATSTLLDSSVEHYRGSFINKAMITPIVVSAASLAVSAHGSNDRSPAAHAVRDPVYLACAITGLVGTGFHIYNVTKRPGRFSWQNLFYGAPLGAPAAVALSGLLGYYSERLRDSDASRGTPRVFGIPAGRALASLTALGLLATSAEAGMLHFRGAYHDPFMYVPVTVPPVAAGLLGETALSRPRAPRRLARWWLRLTAFVGLVGPCFHIFGVSRNMGGWKDWRQNVLNGPPIPAPPSFTGLALAGLAALDLLEEHPNA